MALYVLHEAASGYALFNVVEMEAIAAFEGGAQASVTDLQRFSKMVKLVAFQPFTSAENALDNIMKVSENLLHEDLAAFLVANLPKAKQMKKDGDVLGVAVGNFGSVIKEETSIPCKADDSVNEVLRGVRLHLGNFVKNLDGGASEKAMLGLGHSYSRAKVKFNVNRQDNMIIQSISLLDQLDKDCNTCAMRVKEWYSWHFPELSKIVADSFIFCRLVQFIGKRTSLSEEKLDALTEITMDDAVSQQILDASRSSIGMDYSDIDILSLGQFADRVVALGKYRRDLQKYLSDKMSVVAPNLGALIGEPVAARLISHAGSLVNLAKCPASTIQILGAEKALFRALKTRGNTPKYGLIFHSSFIGRAGQKNKGRISRYLANKCAIAARVDFFSEVPNNAYGERLKEQVEDRLAFYDTGATPKKNLEVMQLAAKEAAALVKASNPDASDSEDEDVKPKKSAKRKHASSDSEDEAEDMEIEATPKKAKKEKKEKKEKKKDTEKKKKKKSM
mmetsp:Transcript_11644/g.20711  ORF Transcript_11644/g.20711 Transcript_11644/m.20711 type:complete len:505 (+) Transcript_11644:184-1698(+)